MTSAFAFFYNSIYFSCISSPDMVIDGKIELSVFDELYPFLEAADVARLFAFAVKKYREDQA